MRYLLFIAILFARISHAQSQEEMQAGCNFVRAWASQAYNIAIALGVPEERWLITNEGYDEATFAMILDIKREAYHDLTALRHRVEMACAEKVGT